MFHPHPETGARAARVPTHLLLLCLSLSPLGCVCAESWSDFDPLPSTGGGIGSHSGGGRASAGGGGDWNMGGGGDWDAGGSGGGGANQGGGGVDDGGAAPGGGNPGAGSDGGGGGGGDDDGGAFDGGDGLVARCDLIGDAGCPCLRVATLGYPGSRKQGDVFSSWLREKAARGVVNLEGDVLTSDVLAAHQVIIIQDVRPGKVGVVGVGEGIGREYASSEVDALARWVEGGGGLLTLTGYSRTTELDNVNRLLALLGLSYSTDHLYTADDAGVLVTNWATHPVTEGVGSVVVYGGYGVNGGTSLAWVGANDVARVREVGRGRVFAWGDESISYSDYLGPADAGVRRLWLNALRWLVPPAECEITFPAGQ